MTQTAVLGETAGSRRQPTTFAGIVGVIPIRDLPDLGRWVDSRFELVEPDTAFFKFYQLRRRPAGMRVGPRFLHYHQVCLSTLVRYDDGDPMHVNLVMWEDRDWAALANRSAMGWPKRMADIVGTWLYPMAGSDIDPDWVQYDFSVVRHGLSAIELRGEITAWGEAPEPPVFDGFLTARPPIPFSDDTSSPVIQIRPYEWVSAPIAQGHAHIELSDEVLADESFSAADIVGGTETAGSFGIHHVRWTIDPTVNTVLTR